MKSRLLAAMLALASLGGAQAAQAEEAGLTAIVADVLARSPSLRAGALRRRAFQDEVAAAGAWPDPTVSVMLDRVPMGEEMPMIRYELSQMVPWPGKLDLTRRAVEQQENSAAAELAVRRLDLRLEAKRAYFMLLLNAKRREVSSAGRGLAAGIAGAALGRYAAGQAGHHDVARAQVEVAAIDVELVNLEGERASMVAMLNALRNRPVDTAIADPSGAPSPMPSGGLAALVGRAAAARPELKGMAAMRSEAQAMAAMARKEPYPDLMTGVWLNQNIGAAPSFGAMIGGTIPIFGAAKQGHLARAFDARAEGVAEDQAEMRAMISSEVAGAWHRAQAAARQMELLRAVALPKARESFEAALASYGTATADLVAVLDARRALQGAELVVAEVMVRREIALAELERAVGGPLGGDGP
ncbi:TolC family protein [Sorangium sp. So ce363]|uniref:TolC family protein n=1 Tax=Sorangium sp. So ce363 TaxID=3133304 RepID=UPI003F638B76